MADSNDQHPKLKKKGNTTTQLVPSLETAFRINDLYK